MVIRCWGARGSIPVFGKEYLKYGGSTTCLEIRTKGEETIIVDAGSGIRRLGDQILRENRRRLSILFTHAHLDHVLGFPFFKPIYSREISIRVFGYHFAFDSLEDMLSKTMSPPLFPVNFEAVKAHVSYQPCESKFSIGSVEVTPTFISHPGQGLGYKFVEDGKCFVFLTDNELTYRHPGGLDLDDYLAFCEGADLLIHDSEFTREEYEAKKTWGHSVYNDALQLALDAKVKKFGLFHHNQDRTDGALDKILQDCRQIIKKTNSALECFGTSEGMQIELT